MEDSDTDIASGSDYEGSQTAQGGRKIAQCDATPQRRVTPGRAAKSRQSAKITDSGQGTSTRSGATNPCNQLEVVWPQALFSLAHSLQTEERLSLTGSSQDGHLGSSDVRISLQKQGENIWCFLEASGAQLVQVVGDRWHCSVSNIGSPGVSTEEGSVDHPQSTSDPTELQIKQEQEEDLSDNGGLEDETLSNEESNNVFNSVPDNDMDDMSDKGDGEVQCQTCDFISSGSQDLLEHIAKSHSTLDNYQDLLLQSEGQIYESKITKNMATSSVIMTCPFPYCQTQRCGKAIFHHMAWCHKEFEPDYAQVFNETRASYEASLVVDAKNPTPTGESELNESGITNEYDGLTEDEATTKSHGRRVLSKARTRPKKLAKRGRTAKNKQEKSEILFADSTGISCPACGFQPKRNRDILTHFRNRHHTEGDFRDMLYELETEFYLKGLGSINYTQIVMECPYCRVERLGRAIFMHLRWCHRNFEPDYNKVYGDLEDKYDLLTTKEGVPLPRLVKPKPNTKQLPKSKDNELKVEILDSDDEADDKDDDQDNEKDEDYVPLNLTPRRKQKRDPTEYEIKGMTCSVCGLKPCRSRDIVGHIHKRHKDLANYQDLLYEFEESYYQLSIERHTYVNIITTCPYCDRVRSGNNIFRHLKWCHRYLQPDFHQVFMEVQRDYDGRAKIAKRRDRTRSTRVRRKVQKARVEAGLPKLFGNSKNSDCNPGNADENNSMDENEDSKSSKCPTKTRGFCKRGLEEPSKKTTKRSTPDRSSKEPLICPYCNITYLSWAVYNNHVHNICARNPELTPWLQCRFCGWRTREQDQMETHIEKHKDKYVCEFCGKQFIYKGQCYMHKRKVHGVGKPLKKMTCAICNIEYPDPTTYRSHMRRHNDKQYTCEHCGKAFRESARLNEHQRKIHFNDFKYRCPKCDYGLHKKRQLKTHVCGKTRKRTRNTDIAPVIMPYDKSLQSVKVEGWRIQKRPIAKDRQDNTLLYPLNKGQFFKELATGTKDVASDPGNQGQAPSQDHDDPLNPAQDANQERAIQDQTNTETTNQNTDNEQIETQQAIQKISSAGLQSHETDDDIPIVSLSRPRIPSHQVVAESDSGDIGPTKPRIGLHSSSPETQDQGFQSQRVEASVHRTVGLGSTVPYSHQQSQLLALAQQAMVIDQVHQMRTDSRAQPPAQAHDLRNQGHDLRTQGQGHFSQEGDSSNQLSHDQDSRGHMTQTQSSQGQGHMMPEGSFTQSQIARAQASGYIWGQPEGHIWPQPDFAGRWLQHPNFFS